MRLTTDCEDYLPVYHAGCEGLSTAKAPDNTVYLLATSGAFCVIIPTSMIYLASPKLYRLVSWLAWCPTLVGLVLMCSVTRFTSGHDIVLFQLILGFGVGSLLAVVPVPVLAPLKSATLMYSASSFVFYIRTLSQVSPLPLRPFYKLHLTGFAVWIDIKHRGGRCCVPEQSLFPTEHPHCRRKRQAHKRVRISADPRQPLQSTTRS